MIGTDCITTPSMLTSPSNVTGAVKTVALVSGVDAVTVLPDRFPTRLIPEGTVTGLDTVPAGKITVVPSSKFPNVAVRLFRSLVVSVTDLGGYQELPQ